MADADGTTGQLTIKSSGHSQSLRLPGQGVKSFKDERNSSGTMPALSQTALDQLPWPAFEDLKAQALREGVGIMQGVQVGSTFCSKLDRLVKAGMFDKAKADYLQNGIT